ncbi:DUF3053 domain-containing protein [Edwardsiella piscicida]|uniref:DUF3053 domain-containing protein n=3 Tax=Edwardsiella TaxID=635 RepID=A0A0H3DNL6_EDWTF|nr:DUF3053 domain-containing protein [Edwardsiella piscicida]ACY82858.1 conserved hypothetical protein [Edwardsiella tarda EIB202]ADM40134.1 hypothetical protein ETAF_0011 [Edwardsiella tarda FL6-60]AGH72144.1 hypothetical protein ETAC_00055 [Edwardsiella piscicida C07-087]ARD18266.1 hypothetical protein BXA22_07900 [Edwardsiella piscicida]EKS7781066.1 DUF3053 domain-containing protein [Edwardsiella piscicida]
MTFAVKTWAQRLLMPVMALFLVMQLSGCGDSDKEQQKAFIDYLQNTVMRGSVTIPTLSEAQKQQLGHYAGDYAVLVTFSQNFNRAMEASMTPLFSTLQQIRTPQEYLTQRDRLQQELGALNMLGQQIQSAKAQADGAYATLKQPEEVKAVFDKAFTKIVTGPSNAVMPMIPQAADVAQTLVQVGDFLQNLGPQARFDNQGVQLQTQAQVDQYNQLMRDLSAKYQTLMAAKQQNAGLLQN